jgi:hypothetical protein
MIYESGAPIKFGEKLVPMPLCPPKIQHGLNRA